MNSLFSPLFCNVVGYCQWPCKSNEIEKGQFSAYQYCRCVQCYSSCLYSFKHTSFWMWYLSSLVHITGKILHTVRVTLIWILSPFADEQAAQLILLREFVRWTPSSLLYHNEFCSQRSSSSPIFLLLHRPHLRFDLFFLTISFVFGQTLKHWWCVEKKKDNTLSLKQYWPL